MSNDLSKVLLQDAQHGIPAAASGQRHCQGAPGEILFVQELLWLAQEIAGVSRPPHDPGTCVNLSSVSNMLRWALL